MASALATPVTPDLAASAQPPFLFPDRVSVSVSHELSFARQVATYTLNQEKQVDELKKDAASGEPSLVMLPVKNDCVQLKISPAFLTAIALPSILSLGSPNGSPYTRAVNDVLLTQPKLPVRHYDATGHIDHHLVQFDISNNSTPPNLIGHLSVHIYHGTRLIQIQCPKQVPDGRTAALWFTDEVLFPLLKARAKAINFNSDIINQIHQAILGAPPDSGQACSTRPLCFACSNRINKISASIKCPTCSKVFHKQKKCSDHVCTPSSPSAPPGDLNPLTAFPDQHVLTSSQSSPSRPARKRAALDTTGFRSSNSRDVRSRSQSSFDLNDSISLTPPLNDTLPPPPAGQGQLMSALAALPLTSWQTENQTSSSLDLAAVPPPVSAPGITKKQKASKKNATPASTPQEMETELLNRQLIATKTKLTSTENALRESKESYAILAKRLAFFEQRENDTNFSYLPPTQANGTPPTSLATLPLLTEIGNIKCILEELQSSVSILLRAAPHPQTAPPSRLPQQDIANMPLLRPAAPDLELRVPSQPQTAPPLHLPQQNIANMPLLRPTAPVIDIHVPPPPSAPPQEILPLPSTGAFSLSTPSTFPTSDLIATQAHTQPAGLLPPLIPTPSLNDTTRPNWPDSCLLYSTTHPANPPAENPRPKLLSKSPLKAPAEKPHPKIPPKSSLKAIRPPTWADVAAKRIPPLFPVWQPGRAPSVVIYPPPPRPPVVRQPGSAPGRPAPPSSHSLSRALVTHQRQPPPNPRHPRQGHKPTPRQWHSRKASSLPEPSQQLLIDLN